MANTENDMTDLQLRTKQLPCLPPAVNLRTADVAIKLSTQLQQKDLFISRANGFLLTAAVACAITLIVAWPVVVAPARLSRFWSCLGSFWFHTSSKKFGRERASWVRSAI